MDNLLTVLLNWFNLLPIEAKTTLIVAAIVSPTVSLFGIAVKRIFDLLSERSAARREIFHNMLEKVHPLYVSSYHKMFGMMFALSKSVNYFLELRAVAHTKMQMREQALIVFHYFSLVQNFLATLEPMFLGDFGAEIAQGELDALMIPYRFMRLKREWQLVFGEKEISTIQRLAANGISLIEFRELCGKNRELSRLFKRFFEWLQESDQSYLQRYVSWTRANSNLIHYHCDMMYASWYRARPPWMTSDDVDCIRTIVPEYRRSRIFRAVVRFCRMLKPKICANKSWEYILDDLVQVT